MSEERELHIDPNTADEKTLLRLPRIGPELARRIVDARPFESKEDLLRVPGIGDDTLTQIEPYITISSQVPPLMEMAERVQERVDEWREVAGQVFEERAEKLREEVSQATDRIQKLSEDAGISIREATKRASDRVAGLPAAFDRVETLWLVIGTGVISIVFSVILSLAILAGINRTLNFGRHEAIRLLETGLAGVQADLENESSRLEVISQRLQALEGLSGRMVSVEDQVSSMQEDVQGTLAQVDTIQTTVDELILETQNLAEHVSRFDVFLDGLHQLLSSLFVPAQPEEPTIP